MERISPIPKQISDDAPQKNKNRSARTARPHRARETTCFGKRDRPSSADLMNLWLESSLSGMSGTRSREEEGLRNA
jgi:hypothetical protein